MRQLPWQRFWEFFRKFLPLVFQVYQCLYLFQRKTGKNSWHTEGVWLDRDEAEIWGKLHHYNYPSGWRVYGVPSEGQLAFVLQRWEEAAAVAALAVPLKESKSDNQPA